MATSHQDNFFHLFNPQPELSGEREPAVDMLHYPPLEIILRESVFTPSCYWQG